VVYFREWVANETICPTKYYYNQLGAKVHVPEGSSIPAECCFRLPDGIGSKHFEDAILELTKEIIQARCELILDREVEGNRDYNHIKFTPQQSTEDKLIDIIKKLVEK